MQNSEYWKKRFEILEESAVSKGAKYYYSLENEYRRASREIQNQIAAWYTRLAHNNKLTLAEARKFLSTSELNEFKWTVKDYIKYGAENGMNQQWMRELENASAKVHISRLEALKVQLQQQMEVLYGNQVDGIDTLARKIYSDGYYHTAYEIQKGHNIGWDLQSLDNRRIEKVLSKPWTADNLTFRDKCWKQKTELVSTVSTTLTQSLMRGAAPDKAIKEIAERFNVAKSKAGRLVMTESAYFASVAQKDCFNDLDVEKFEIVATLDSRTSAICQELDGQVFDMKDYQPGVTAPPFHPWCRTTTVPYFEDNYGERIARGLDGNTYYVPSDMTYKEWKKSQDEKFGVGAVDKQHKMLYNTSADKAQFAKYKERLGSDAPRSFKDFQKIKYDMVDEYTNLSELYKYKGRVPEATVEDFNHYKAIKALDVKGVIRVPPLPIDVSGLEVLNDHAFNHGCTLDDAKEYITSAKCSITRNKWDGKHINYYSLNGATYLNEDGKVNTIFSKNDFDPKTDKIVGVFR